MLKPSTPALAPILSRGFDSGADCADTNVTNRLLSFFLEAIGGLRKDGHGSPAEDSDRAHWFDVMCNILEYWFAGVLFVTPRALSGLIFRWFGEMRSRSLTLCSSRTSEGCCTWDTNIKSFSWKENENKKQTNKLFWVFENVQCWGQYRTESICSYPCNARDLNQGSWLLIRAKLHKLKYNLLSGHLTSHRRNFKILIRLEKMRKGGEK